MALELMREEMVRQIRARSATDAHAAAYLTVWNDAILHSGKPLPCPACYLNGETRRLKPLREEHGIATVRCEHCREIFEFHSPEIT